MRSQISKTASGVTRFNISKERFKKIQIPIPCPDNPDRSLAIQAEIVRILDTFTALTAELTSELTVELTTSEPDAFLPINLTNLFMASPAHWQKKFDAAAGATPADKSKAAWTAFAADASGSGPFKMSKFTPRERNATSAAASDAEVGSGLEEFGSGWLIMIVSPECSYSSSDACPEKNCLTCSKNDLP